VGRDLDDVGSEICHVEPPCGGQSGRRGPSTESPHGSSDSGGVVEWAVVDEEDAARAAAPMARSDTAFDRILAQSDLVSLSHRDDAIVAAY